MPLAGQAIVPSMRGSDSSMARSLNSHIGELSNGVALRRVDNAHVGKGRLGQHGGHALLDARDAPRVGHGDALTRRW